MKHQLLSFATLIVMFSTALCSCQNVEEPENQIKNEVNNKEMFEYSITVNVQDDIRTRGTSNIVIGESGLFEPGPRTIDKLWYAIYYDGALISNSEMTRNDDSPFKVSYRTVQKIDPTKLYFLLWAGNSEDKIAYDSSFMNDTDAAVIFDFSKKSIKVNPAVLNDYENMRLYDSFSDFVQFSDQYNDTSKSKTFLLKRPFIEIHVLTDEFQNTDAKTLYPEGVTCFAGFGGSRNGASWSASGIYDLNCYSVWDYANKSGSYYYSSYTYNSSYGLPGFYNDLKGSKTITYNGKKYDYLAYFLMFPLNSDNYLHLVLYNGKKEKISTQTDLQKGKNISLSNKVYLKNKNTRYVFYSSVEDGGEGLFDYNDFDIVVDNDDNWSGLENP